MWKWTQHSHPANIYAHMYIREDYTAPQENYLCVYSYTPASTILLSVFIHDQNSSVRQFLKIFFLLRITGNVGVVLTWRNGQKRLFFLMAILSLGKYDVITHTAHVNMVSTHISCSRTEVVRWKWKAVSVAITFLKVYGAPRSAGS